MWSTYSACRSVSVPKAGRPQQIGKADDVGQRRAQLVGDVLDEVVLQLVGHPQRFVLFGQRAFDAHAVGDVDEGQHRLRIRQRNDGEIQDEAGTQFQDSLAGAAARRRSW